MQQSTIDSLAAGPFRDWIAKLQEEFANETRHHDDKGNLIGLERELPNSPKYRTAVALGLLPPITNPKTQADTKAMRFREVFTGFSLAEELAKLPVAESVEAGPEADAAPSSVETETVEPEPEAEEPKPRRSRGR